MRKILFFVTLLSACSPKFEAILVTPENLPPTSLTLPPSDSCIDLEIISIKLLEKNKKKAIVEYTLRNNGNLPINFEGDTRKKDDNLAMQIFFSGDEKYNRGDLLVEGLFVNAPESNIIPPNNAVRQKMEISLSRKTSFHGYLILHIDPTQRFRECDETNNYASMKF